jgi:hypothetical protein
MKTKILDVDNNEIYYVQKFMSKFVVFEVRQKGQICRSGHDEQYTFSNLEILLDLSFFCNLEYIEFKLRFCRLVDVNIIYI